MPVVHVYMLRGRTRKQKSDVIEGVTKVLSEKAGAKMAATQVIITEVDKENFGENGKQL